MGEIRSAGMYTRRSVLTFAAVAPLLAQSEKTTKSGGGKMAHPVVHFEIGCRDIAKTEQFFGELFGWQMQRNGPMSAIDSGGQGIPGHITTLGHEPLNYTIFYVEVDDVKVSLDKAVALGGKMLVPPIKIPTGTFAWFADPEGNTIGLLKRA